MDPARHCEDLVRRADEDRYLSTVFAPGRARPHLFALYAFNFEVARSAEAVSQPVAGQIRLQWWRDAIEGIYTGKAPEHPVAIAVAETLSTHDLPRNLFDELVDAREADFKETPFADFSALERYADATSGNVMRLAARILGAGAAVDDAARNAGIAYALAGLLRARPFHAARGRAVIADAMAELAAQRAMDLFRAVPRVSRRYLPALLPAALVPIYLRALARGIEVMRVQKQWRMLRAMLRGRL